MENKLYAHCIINNKGDEVHGIVKFSTAKDGTRVQARVTGMSKGLHGFHIH